MPENEPANGRVTMRTLDDQIALVRQETKTELTAIRGENKTQHVITRAIVIILATPNVARAIPYLLGVCGVHIGRWPW